MNDEKKRVEQAAWEGAMMPMACATMLNAVARCSRASDSSSKGKPSSGSNASPPGRATWSAES